MKTNNKNRSSYSPPYREGLGLGLVLKQALSMIRENRLFTGIYIAGTALAIASTTIMAIIYYVKIANIYPETNRDRICYLNNIAFEKNVMSVQMGGEIGEVLTQQGPPSKNDAKILDSLNSVDYYTIMQYYNPTDYASPLGERRKVTAMILEIDHNFFRIYEFRFKEGNPITQADVESKTNSAVITDKLARELFGKDTDVVGRDIRFHHDTLHVVGVVEAGSKLARLSYSDIYRPHTSDDYRGTVVIMPKEGCDANDVRVDLQEAIDRFNTSNEGKEKMSVFRYPISHIQSVFDLNHEEDFTWADVIRKYLIIVLALLLVPSLNLSGMISRRMEGRMAEMGIRKSFGATKRGLLTQVLNENLILTVIGGIFGLLIAWLAVYAFRSSVFNLFGRMVYGSDIPLVTGEMLFSPTIFITAFLVCVVLNILSALIPAWLSLRKPIVESMNERR